MRQWKWYMFVLVIPVLFMLLTVENCTRDTSDSRQQDQQEQMLKEATAQCGVPLIKNFRERKLMKYIMELCDQEGVVTYTYLENMNPVVVPGKTALGGKLTFLANTIGYGIPSATQYTNPQKVEWSSGGGYVWTLPQADPNGMFKPSSANGTWIIVMNPETKKAEPAFIEPNVLSFPYKLPFD